MSQGKRTQTFIERVPYEAQIEDQVRIFRYASNENNLQMMQNSCETMYDLIVDLLGEDNPDFQAAMTQLNDDNFKRYSQKLIIYQAAVKGANCPEVVPKPSKRMNRDQLRSMFRVLIKLCRDKKILMTPRSDAVF